MDIKRNFENLILVSRENIRGWIKSKYVFCYFKSISREFRFVEIVKGILFFLNIIDIFEIKRDISNLLNI